MNQQLLLPISLPFIEKSSKFYFPVNYSQQAFCYVILYCFMIINYLFFYTVTKHILIELDLIIELCKKIGQEEEKHFIEENTIILKNKKVPVLKIVGENRNASENPPNLSSIDLIKILLERHLQIRSIIDTTANFYYINIPLWEMISITSCCFAYYATMIYHGFYNQLIGTAFLLLQYLMVCYMSTNILEKHGEIGKVLYTSKWYYLSVKEKKALINIIQMSQKTCTLSSGGFGYVSLERYNDVRDFYEKNCQILFQIILI